MKGIIKRIESKDIYVLQDSIEYRCSLRGKLKLETEHKGDKFLYKDIVVPGDNVEFQLLENGTGVIDSIPERKNYISRKAPRIKGVSEKGRRSEQIIAANIDKTFCICSLVNPVFNNRVLDRLIVIAESCQSKPVLVFNKYDISEKEWVEYWLNLYNKLKYECIVTSAKTRKGIKEIKKELEGNTSLFVGHSGVGKSSIINRLDKNIDQKTGDVSDIWEKGRHTTVTANLFEIGPETYVIDTPGIKEIEPYGLTREDITHYFKEIAEHSPECRFNTCTHTHEPKCAVKDAVEAEEISVERYESYLRLVESLEENEY